MKTITSKKFVFNTIESILVIGYIVFEEVIWNVFAKPIYQYFKKLVILNSFKNTFLSMNRYLLLSIFLLIFIITEIMGFVSAFFVINGYFYSGIIIYASKIPIAAFTFWLFELTKDQLMTFNWLKASYRYIMNLVGKFIHSDIYVYIKTKISKVKNKIAQFVQKHSTDQRFISSIKNHYSVFKHYLQNAKPFTVRNKTTNKIS